MAYRTRAYKWYSYLLLLLVLVIWLYYSLIAMAKPSYGELIDMLNAAESEAAKCRNTHASILLHENFREKYNNVSIGRPERFYDTVSRIAAPTRPSLKGTAKLLGSPLITYRRRTWVPKNTREKAGI